MTKREGCNAANTNNDLLPPVLNLEKIMYPILQLY